MRPRAIKPTESGVAAISLPIRRAAAEVGVEPETLREYERLGLLKPRRNGIGQREYSLADVAQARKILRERLESRSRGLLKGRRLST